MSWCGQAVPSAFCLFLHSEQAALDTHLSGWVMRNDIKSMPEFYEGTHLYSYTDSQPLHLPSLCCTLLASQFSGSFRKHIHPLSLHARPFAAA